MQFLEQIRGVRIRLTLRIEPISGETLVYRAAPTEAELEQARRMYEQTRRMHEQTRPMHEQAQRRRNEAAQARAASREALARFFRT